MSKTSNITRIKNPIWNYKLLIRLIHIALSLFSMLLILDTLFTPVVFISVPRSSSIQFISMSITSLGTKRGDARLFNLVSFNSGIGIYVLLGLILLVIILGISSIFLNIMIELATLFLTIILAVINILNVNIISSTTSYSSANVLNIVTPFNMDFFLYAVIAVTLIAIVMKLADVSRPNTYG